MVRTFGMDPETLNPITMSSSYAGYVANLIYESLYDLDFETFERKPHLAKRWEISKDKLHYTFYLREDVKWQDGKPFTAEDVLYTYERVQDPKVDAAPLRNYFKDVLRAEKLGLYTVRFIFRRPNIGAMETLGLLKIIPKHLFDDGQDFNSHSNNRKPMGTGPYQFVEWLTGQRIILKKFEGYWGKPYAFTQMVFKIIPDDLTSFQLLKKGEIDLMGLSPIQWTKQTTSPKFSNQFAKHNFFTPFGGYGYIGWNLRRPYFKDRRVRLALAHLIDRQTINEKIFFGLYSLITGPYYPYGEIYDHRLKPILYNLQRAKKLLEEAGWKDQDGNGIREKEGVPFRFTFLFPSGIPFYEQLMPILYLNFKKAGMEVDLRRLDGVTFFKLIHEQDFDAYIAAWGRGTDLNEDLYQIWHSSQIDKGSNFVGFAHDEVDHLLEQGRLEFNKEKRIAMYRQVQKILYEEQPYCFMFSGPSLVARHQRFKNVEIYPGGLEIKRWTLE